MNDDPKTDLNLALNHPRLFKGITNLALKNDGEIPEKIEEFSEKKIKIYLVVLNSYLKMEKV